MKCVDCGGKARRVEVSHSFQCDECQSHLFNRLRLMAGSHPRNKKENEIIEKVKQGLEEGLKGYVIADSFGIGRETVYDIMKKIGRRG